MNRAIQFLSNLGAREEGQTLTEYALILSVKDPVRAGDRFTQP